MTLTVLPQDSFAGGVHRLSEPQRIPPDSVYDALNALLDDEGSIYRRGGTAYLGTVLGSASWRGFVAVDIGALRRYLGWNVTNNLVTFDDSLANRVSLGLSDRPPGTSKPTVVGGMACFPSVSTANKVLAYGGARLATYSTGTIAVSDGSRTVTGTGTSWLANVDAGAVLTFTSVDGAPLVVESVQSDTSLTVVTPVRNMSGSGLTYTTSLAASFTVPNLLATGTSNVLAAVGNRLVVCKDNRAVFSQPRDPDSFNATDYHELLTDATTLGAEGFRDTLVWFTTRGVWTISNMAFDLTDDQGNVQHQVAQVNKDLTLWGHPDMGGSCGVVGWSGALIVPAVDDIHVLTLDGATQTVSDRIRPLYRSYVKAGYFPGMATVFNGHYLLPIINSSFVTVDLLVCKLAGAVWTRWGTPTLSLSVAPGTASTPQKMYGVQGTRLVDYTDTFSTSSLTDVDGSAPSFEVITRDYVLARQQNAYWKYLRARYEAEGSGSLTVRKANGSGSFSLLSETGGVSDGTVPVEFTVDERSQAVRFKLIAGAGGSGAVTLRSFEVHARASGKR